MVKNLPAMRETPVGSLGWEDPLEKGMATHSSILAWRIPWTEEPGGLQSMESYRVRHDWGQTLSLFSIAGSVGSIPGQGTKILLAPRHGPPKKIHNRTMSFFCTSAFDYLILSKKNISPCDPACMHTYATENSSAVTQYLNVCYMQNIVKFSLS